MPRRPTPSSPAVERGAPAAPCPCGGQPPGAGYLACCARLIETGQAAPDAASLMRARYTAYTQDNFAYLRHTWHPRTCPPDLEHGADDAPRPRWLGLTIKRHTPLDPDHAEVEFVARSKVGGRAQRLHEISRFTRLNGNWVYLDGDLF